MATIEMFETARTEAPARTGFLSHLIAALRSYRRHVQERRIIVRLSRLDSHLLRDMGFEPADIHAALEGSWDEDPRRSFPRV